MRQQRPNGSDILVGQRHSGDIRVPTREQIGSPAVAVVIAAPGREDGRARSMDQQGAQVDIAAFADPSRGGGWGKFRAGQNPALPPAQIRALPINAP